MGKIIQFPAKQPSKFGFERVRKRKKEDPDQLDLFRPGVSQVRRLPTNMSSFDEALLLDERGDGRAEKLYCKAISECDFVADSYCNLGVLESKAGRVAKAFDCFTKALAHDPRHFEAHYNLGNLYFEVDDILLARTHYELASEIDPEFPNLFFNLGLVLVLLDEKEAALDAFVRYQLLAPREERRNADDLISGLRSCLATATRSLSLLP